MFILATSQSEVHRLIEQFVLGPWPWRMLAEAAGILVIGIALGNVLTRKA